MGCMKTLKGKWLLSGPFRVAPTVELSTENGQVKGRTTIDIEGESTDFRVSHGVCNGATVELFFVNDIGENDFGDKQFNYAGNCVGEDVFNGGCMGQISGAATLKLIK